jgi:RNA polymerase sigma factor (sigma-70 family)
MSDSSSISTWIGRLRLGDAAAAGHLWQRYHARLIELARQNLIAPLRGEAEDVVSLAFCSFVQAMQLGRYPDITHRDQLWRMLLTLTLNQSRRLNRDAGRQRRDIRRTLYAADLFDLPDADLDRLAGSEPDPALAAQINDELRDLLERLPEDLRVVAVDVLAGWTVAEIANRLKVCVRTIQRRLERIRQFWLTDEPSD